MLLSSSKLAVSQVSTSVIMLTCGTAYMFALYGPQLSQKLNYSALETAFMAASANAGVYLGGPIVGLKYFVDRYPYNTKYFLIFGGSLIFLGYYAIGTLMEMNIRLPYLLISIIYFMIGIGSCASYSSSLVTNYRNWPVSYRSTSIGLSVSFFGLSAFAFGAVGTALYSTGGQLEVESLLKFLGITCLVLNIAGSFTLKLKSEQIPAIIFNIDGRFEETPLLRDSETANYLSVSSPIIYEHEITEYAEEREQRCQQEPLGIEGEVQSAITSIAILDRESEILDRIELEDIICFRSLDSYLLGTNMVIIVGVGLMYINNVGSISIIDLN